MPNLTSEGDNIESVLGDLPGSIDEVRLFLSKHLCYLITGVAIFCDFNAICV